MLTPIGRAGGIILFAALLFVGVGWHLQLAMERKLTEISDLMGTLAQEHAAALEAAAQAAKMKESIHEEFSAREKDLQSGLANHDSFGALLIPPELRAILSGQNNCQPTPAPAGANQAASQGQP